MNVLTPQTPEAWNTYVRSFAGWDIYYLCEYAVSLKLHGDGEPLLLCFEHDAERMCYVVMRNDIADDPRFHGLLPAGRHFDLETPYGYGGPLTDAPLSPVAQQIFMEELRTYCLEQRIVTQFLRYHPLLDNHGAVSPMTDTRYLRDTIYMDTASPELILANMDSKNRNMVRKAQRSGVTVREAPMSEYAPFLELYRQTMDKHSAEDYYTFGTSYFDYLCEHLSDHAFLLYAELEEAPISGAIFFHTNGSMHYHLAGSDAAYRSLAAGNLLLYEAALWGTAHGMSKLHLGGGMAPDDSLFGFKKQFNKNGRREFWVGRSIFDPAAYQELLALRKSADPAFDPDNGFMIQYRR